MHDRLALVAALGHVRIDRDLAEERHAGFLGQFPAAAVAEYVMALAVRADEVAHVLDDAEHRHAHLAEHFQALASVDQADVLRRCDDDGAGQRSRLRQRQLGVARAGRQIDYEIIELAPSIRVRNSVTALWTIGPRQMTAWVGG